MDDEKKQARREKAKDRRRKKHEKSKRLYSAPSSIVAMPNADKKNHETWKKGQNLARFPAPFRCCILGKVNSGKSLILTHILLAHQAKRPQFKEVIVVHGDINTKEYDRIEPTEIRETIPEPHELEGGTKRLVILDDVDFSINSKQKTERLSNLFRWISTHHHVSVILAHQSWFRIPKIAKDCSNVFIIFRPHDNDELATIGRRVGLKKDDIFDLFKTCLPNWRDSLTIDLCPNSPAKFRRNLFEPIQIDDDKKEGD
jgi:hypothetical protein